MNNLQFLGWKEAMSIMSENLRASLLDREISTFARIKRAGNTKEMFLALMKEKDSDALVDFDKWYDIVEKEWRKRYRGERDE